MREDEARQRWCPFAQPGAVRPEDCGEVRGNRNMDGNIDPGAHCIASACMAWRWDEPWTSQSEEGVGGDIVIRLKRKPGEPQLGFCGLAGAPR